MKTLFLSLLSVLTVQAETLQWNLPAPDPQNVIIHHRVTITTNNVHFASFNVAMPSTNLQFTAVPGFTYTLSVEAVRDDLVPSQPVTVIYTKGVTAPPPTLPVPPRVDISGKPSIEAFRQGNWINYRLEWTNLNLPAYGATNYLLKIESHLGTNTLISFSNWYTFGTLPFGQYAFRVYTIGQSGQSPHGTAWLQSGSRPKDPTGALVPPP